MTETDVAKKEGTKSKGKFTFKFHLMIFIIVIGMLYIINITTTPSLLWVFYPLFSWLVAICLHLTVMITKKFKPSTKTLLAHISIYLSVNLLLGVINYMSSEVLTWVLYPLFFWGIGVLFHGIIYEEFYYKKPPKVKEGKMKVKLKEKFPQLDRSLAKQKRDKLLSAYNTKADNSIKEKAAPKGSIKPPNVGIKPKGAKTIEIPESVDVSEEDKKELEKVESEMDIEEKEVFCIVHKGPIVGTIYICPQCKTYYCFKCVNTLKENGEKCWSCDAEINP